MASGRPLRHPRRRLPESVLLRADARRARRRIRRGSVFELEAALRPPTRVVALSEVGYSTGYRAPVGEIGRIARDNGALFFLDGTQSLGALACDLRHVRPDVYAVDGYKWLLAPNGAAFAYVSKDLRKILPPAVIGWRSHKDWRNHANLHHGIPEFKEEAERYEGGMLPFSLLYALEASVELFLELGPDAVERRVLELASAVRRVAVDLGGCVDSSPDSPIVTIRFPNQDAEAVAHRLADDRVLVAARRGNLRVSPHIYNDEGDIERLRASLVTLLS
ncbi:MAG: aminotransferase class V-fold PLP-dependent enzyme [Bryobacterales bacterium]|nr:aminotransferase class V-fold PLP-dependent enzyme [Bryobacterales bacterium]